MPKKSPSQIQLRTRSSVVLQVPVDRIGTAEPEEMGLAKPVLSLRVRRIVKQHRQLDAAVAELWKVVFRRIAGVEVRRGIIRREQQQRIQERLQGDLSIASERRILVA